MFEIRDDKLLQYHGTEATVVIPAGVKVIGKEAFKDNWAVEEVFFSDVEIIERSAFQNCQRLRAVVFSDSLREILAYAFEDCVSLRKIEFHSPVEVCSGAFRGCHLEEVTGPAKDLAEDSTLQLAAGVCLMCSGGMTQQFADGTRKCTKCGHVYTTEEQWQSRYFLISAGELIGYNGGACECWISDGVRTIGAYAFDDMACAQLRIPPTVKAIEPFAFTWFRTASEVAIHVKRVEHHSFAEMSSPSIELGSQVEYVGADALAGTRLLDFTCPNLKYVGDGALQRTSFLRQATISGSTEAIGDYAFYQSGVQTVHIKGALSIGNHAFWGCRYLRFLELREGLLTIGEEAFAECHSLEIVTIPSGCQHIGRNAFQNCFSLKVLKLPYTLRVFDKVWLGLPEQTRIEYVF